MPKWFREWLSGGLSLVLLTGLFLVWLWRPERQVALHSDHLLDAIEHKNWTRFASLIGTDYQDQWGNDRNLVLERTHEVFRYLRDVRLSRLGPDVRLDGSTGYWRAQIVVEGDENEAMTLIKERVNNLQTPLELQWRHVSGKPWDWKLVRVQNDELKLPAEIQ